jgi:glycosyltransferase involved in cell wall biosynthesis
MSLYGGAETVIVHLAQHLKRRDIPVSIFTLSSTPHPEYEGLEIVVPPPESQATYRIRGGGVSHIAEIITLMVKLRKHIHRHVKEYDVVNPHNFPAVWATPHDRPTVWMCNEVPDLWHLHANQHNAGMIKQIVAVGRVFDRRIVNSRVDEAIVADRENARIFMRHYGWCPRVIHYGIESGMFGKRPSESQENMMRQKFGLDDQGFYVIQVGMISPSKNQLRTLEGLRQLGDRIPEIKTIFVGYREAENHYTQVLDAYVRNNGLDSRVLFTGHVNKSELRTLYHIAHLAVFPGGWQGSWLSPFEALSAEKPVIVSPTILCSSLIREQNIGLVSDCLHETIFDVYKDYSTHLKIARKGKQFVLHHLTWERFCGPFTDILRGAAKQ